MQTLDSNEDHFICKLKLSPEPSVILQWRQKVRKVGGAECSYIAGTCTVRKVHSEHAKLALFLGESGGMPPPQEKFEK